MSRSFKLVEIQWIDAEKDQEGWSEDDPHAEPLVLRTFGLLVRKDKNYVVHASTYDPEAGRYSERAKIPVGMVISIREIETVEIADAAKVL